MPWSQEYAPFSLPALNLAAALFPPVLLLLCLALFRLRAHLSALMGLAAAVLVALLAYHQPPQMTLAAAFYGAAYGILPIGWIILNLLFFFRLNRDAGLFSHLQQSIAGISPDRRLQLVLIAFCFGAFLEGAAGFGTPSAVSTTLLIGLGFPPIQAASLSLLANTAPVPFAGLGTPTLALQTVSGLDLHALTRATVLQLSLIALILPFWLVSAWCGLRRAWEIWPALLITGLFYALTQAAAAWLHGPWLVSILAALTSMGALMLFLRFWRPKEILRGEDAPAQPPTAAQIRRAWAPWLLLTLLVFLLGLPPLRDWLDSFTALQFAVPGLHNLVLRQPPVTPQPAPIAAVYDLPWLTTPGSAILAAGVLCGLWLGYSPAELLRAWRRTLAASASALVTLAAMMALGFVMRYAGMDATLGLAFAAGGVFYPLLAPVLGWLGVTVTGSDTSSNVLFGSLQRITAQRLGLDPVQITAANSSGGVMGKMINPQSIVIVTSAADLKGQESAILRRVLLHSLTLLFLISVMVLGLARWAGS